MYLLRLYCVFSASKNITAKGTDGPYSPKKFASKRLLKIFPTKTDKTSKHYRCLLPACIPDSRPVLDRLGWQSPPFFALYVIF